MSIDDIILEVKTQNVGNSNKRVLLVEGDDDFDAISIFLNKKSPSWEQHWVLVPAKKKDNVLKILEKEPDWIGLVDRDEWTETDIDNKASQLQNLVILPRFCLESYLVEPTELWSALPEKQRLKIGEQANLAHAINIEKPKWLRHAALWHAINPLWRELRSLGFNNAVLKPENVPDDDELRRTFSLWHNALDIEKTLLKVQALTIQFQDETDVNFYTQHLYAKKFYPMVVHVTLNNLLGQKKAKERRKAILRNLPLPADLDVLWKKMELQ